MFGGGVSTATESRIFHSAVVHSVDSDRDVIVGRVLDQQELRSGTSVPRSYDRSDDDDNSGYVEGCVRLVSESNRRLVRCLLVSRLRCPPRVRLRQRLCSQREKDFGAVNVD